MPTLSELIGAQRILYGAVAVFMAAGSWVHLVHQEVRAGVTPASVAGWYRGNEEDPEARTLLFARSAAEVSEDAWMAATTYALAGVVFMALLVRTDLRRGTLALHVAGWAMVTLGLTAGPFLVRYGSSAWAAAESALLLGAPLLASAGAGTVVWNLWRPRSGASALRGDGGSRLGLGVVVLLALVLGAAWWPAPAAAQARSEDVLMGPGEALREIFPAAVFAADAPWRASAAERSGLESRLGRAVPDSSYLFRAVYGADRRLLGYALVTEERGKYRPITFMVGITPDLRVKDVAVLVYREDRGGEVASRRFLSQYRGKGARDPIRTNRDIVNISGATISVRSVNEGVRRVLALAATAFAHGPPASGVLRPIPEVR